MNKTITTIIPFFNSGQALKGMLDSILNGSVVPDEILLIDDGSTDDSVELAKSYAEKLSNIHYFRQEHAGVSAARNLGLANASGHWISFLDADDYIETSMYESMISSLDDDSLSGCVAGYFTHKNGIVTSYVGDYPNGFNSFELLKAMFCDDNVRGFLVNKLFLASLIKDERFITGIGHCEDLLFITKILVGNPDLKFAYAKESVYHYIQSDSSATGSLKYFENGIFIYKPAFDKILKLVKKDFVVNHYEEILEYSMYMLLVAYRAGDLDVKSQIRLLQKELKSINPSKFSKRRWFYIHCPILFSLLRPDKFL